MVIEGIKIYGFGNIISKEYSLISGVSRISCTSKNEAIALRDFIISALFGFSGRTEGGFRKIYFPGTMLKFGGELLVEFSGRHYLICRLWGTTCSDDTTRVFEMPDNKQIRINTSKPIGEQLFNISKSAFLSSYMVDFDSDCEDGFVGYLTGSMDITKNFENSFKSADKRFSDRLGQIKSVEKKNGELDKLVIQKMSMNNELTRLGETDSKINTKKKKIEDLIKSRDGIKEESKTLFQKIRVAKAFNYIIEKDKAIAVLNELELNMNQLDELSSTAKLQEKRSYFKENVAFVIMAIVGIVLGILGIFYSAILAIIGFSLLAVGVLISVLRYLSFNKRFIIKLGEDFVNIYEAITNFDGAVSEKTAELNAILNGRTYEEAKNSWNEAEEVLRDASEEDRRNATLNQSDEDIKSYNEIVSKLEPIENEISLTEHEIDELTLSLAESYSEASNVLFGIDSKIKALTDEYKITNLAYKSYKETVLKIQNDIMPKIFEIATKIFGDNYGTEKISYSCDENLGIHVNASKENIKKAIFALKIATSKSVLTSEFGISLVSFSELPPEIASSKLPGELRQLIILKVD